MASQPFSFASFLPPLKRMGGQMPGGRARGAANLPLDENGVNETHSIGAAISSIGVPIRRIFTSTRKRGIQTGQILAQHLGAPMDIRHGLDPWPMGGLEGQPERSAEPVADMLRLQRPDDVPPGLSPAESLPAESFNTYKDRYLGELDRIMQEHTDGDREMIVGHGSDIRTTGAWADAGFPHSLDIHTPGLLRDPSGPGSMYALQRDPTTGTWRFGPHDLRQGMPPGIYIQRHGDTDWNG